MSDIKIQPVLDRRDREAFIAVYRELYRGDPHACIPLAMDMRAAIDPARSSFLKNNANAAWVAYRDTRPVGRIMAVRNEAHLSKHQDGAGQFGYLEFTRDPGVIEGLLHAAMGWMRDQNLAKIVGPFSPSINHETGLLVDGFDKPPTYMMNYAPPYYGEYLERGGFSKIMDVFSYATSTDRSAHPPAVQHMLSRIRDRPELRLRTLDTKHYRRDIDLLVEIYNDGWANNWGSVPITKEEAQELGTLLRPLISPSWLNFVEVDGQAIAVTLQMPDLNEAIRDLHGHLLPLGWAKLLYRMRRPLVSNSRMLMLGVRQAWQRRSAGPMAALLLIDSSFEAANKAGIKSAELGWVLETNQAIRSVIEKFATSGRKTYRIYEKTI